MLPGGAAESGLDFTHTRLGKAQPCESACDSKLCVAAPSAVRADVLPARVMSTHTQKMARAHSDANQQPGNLERKDACFVGRRGPKLISNAEKNMIAV